MTIFIAIGITLGLNFLALLQVKSVLIGKALNFCYYYLPFPMAGILYHYSWGQGLQPASLQVTILLYKEVSGWEW